MQQGLAGFGRVCSRSPPLGLLVCFLLPAHPPAGEVWVQQGNTFFNLSGNSNAPLRKSYPPLRTCAITLAARGAEVSNNRPRLYKRKPLRTTPFPITLSYKHHAAPVQSHWLRGAPKSAAPSLQSTARQSAAAPRAPSRWGRRGSCAPCTTHRPTAQPEGRQW